MRANKVQEGEVSEEIWHGKKVYYLRVVFFIFFFHMFYFLNFFKQTFKKYLFLNIYYYIANQIGWYFYF